ncbi:MAG: succinate--CoA ligase subunit alpha [Candidatus Aenigmarchaeota archaeon]|nr:succinate--CoA ligase subunit alpha [Candidatus Aenigmarchaeota archaeon]
MAILVNSETKVCVQGITGKAGTLHTGTMLEYGTKIVSGVRPGAEGEEVLGIPVFNRVSTAVEETGANSSIIFVPAAMAKGAALEAINAGIKLIVIIPEHVPLHDELEIMQAAEDSGIVVVGPNTPGLIAPSLKCKIGFVPNKYYIPGSVGVMARSGTLTYEIVSRLTLAGIGQSTAIGVGGDPVIGSRFPDLIKKFEADPETKVILLIGEVGGTQEEEAAALVADGKIKKPVVAYIAGFSAPPGKRLGHAGAIISGSQGTMESKLKSFQKAGIAVAKTPSEVLDLVKQKLR